MTIALLWVTLNGQDFLVRALTPPPVCQQLVVAYAQRGFAAHCELLNPTSL